MGGRGGGDGAVGPGPGTTPETGKKREDDFMPVGDLYAPFFDVAFYAPIKPEGQAVVNVAAGNLEAAARLLDRIPGGLGAPRAARLRERIDELRGAGPASVAATEELGAGRLSLRSVGGGIRSYDPAGPNSAVSQLVNYRAQLQITQLSAAALQATLTLNPPYEEALRIVDNRLIRFGSLMEIQWGYLNLQGGKPVISQKGLFTITQPSLKFGKQITVTIGGFDVLSSSLRSSDTRCQWKREQYPCDLNILQKIASTRAPSLVLDFSKVSPNSRLRKRKTNAVIQADDDWIFFRRLCRQNDVHFTSDHEFIKLEDRERLDAAPSKYRLTWFMDPENANDIPMMSFETNPHFGYFANQGARGQVTYCRDPDTGDIRAERRRPDRRGRVNIGSGKSDGGPRGFTEDRTRTSEGDVAPFAPIDEACSSGRVYLNTCKRPNLDEEIERENDMTARNFNTKASAICPGHPGLTPQQIVCVANVGKVFSGNYRVMKVTHTIGKGYVMNIDLLRTSSTSDTKDGTPDTTGRDNTKCEPPPPGQLVTPRQGDDGPTITTGGTGPGAGCINDEATQSLRDAIQIIRDVGGRLF